MSAREIRPKIFSVGALDWDRRLFDELISLPNGTTYNSYLTVSIKGLPREPDFSALRELAAQVEQKHRAIGIVK